MKVSSFWLLLCCVFVAASPAGAQQTQFTFAWPHGLEYSETVKTTVIKEMQGQARTTDVTITVGHVKVAKSSSGYLLKATPLRSSMTRNGKKVENPFTRLALNRTFVYKLSPRGELISISGYEAFIKDMKAALPRQAHPLIASVLNPQSILNREKAEWNGRITQFLGRSVKAGDRWVATDKFPLPTGNLVFYSVTSFPAIKIQGKRTLTTIRFTYDTDASAMRKHMQGMVHKLPASSGAKIKVGPVALRGKGERVIDARTMFIVSEKIERVISSTVATHGKPDIRQTRNETKEYSYRVINPGR